MTSISVLEKLEMNR